MDRSDCFPPFADDVAREELHTRRIEMRGFRPPTFLAKERGAHTDSQPG
jgi:hypothetical protein